MIVTLMTFSSVELTFLETTMPVFAVTIRTRLHRHLGLPLDRPLLRSANALSFDDAQAGSAEASTSGRLLDVHVGIKPSGGGSADSDAVSHSVLWELLD